MQLFSLQEDNFLFTDKTHWMLMLEHIPAAIAVFDTDLRYIAVTQRWLDDYELNDQHVLGRSHYEIFPDVPQRWKDIHQNCLQGNIQRCEEDPFLREDGSTVWIRWEIHPWLKPDQSVGGIVMFTEVITAQKELQQINLDLEKMVHERTQALSIAREKAESANQAKSDFLSHMSHELRTPLNAILGFAQILESETEETLTEGQLESVKEITRAGQHLFTLIEEILELSDIESGSLDMDIDIITLNEVLQRSMGMVKAAAKEKGIQIFNHTACHAETPIKADPLRLKQILINLLSNAIKYNKQDGIVHIKSEVVNDNALRIKISDTGQGIRQQDLEEIFKPFERLDVNSAEIEGRGIGLPLARKLANAMGCRIDVKSEYGKGSVFWIDIPMAEDQSESKPGNQVASSGQ